MLWILHLPKIYRLDLTLDGTWINELYLSLFVLKRLENIRVVIVFQLTLAFAQIAFIYFLHKLPVNINKCMSKCFCSSSIPHLCLHANVLFHALNKVWLCKPRSWVSEKIVNMSTFLPINIWGLSSYCCWIRNHFADTPLFTVLKTASVWFYTG